MTTGNRFSTSNRMLITLTEVSPLRLPRRLLLPFRHSTPKTLPTSRRTKSIPSSSRARTGGRPSGLGRRRSRSPLHRPTTDVLRSWLLFGCISLWRVVHYWDCYDVWKRGRYSFEISMCFVCAILMKIMKTERMKPYATRYTQFLTGLTLVPLSYEFCVANPWSPNPIFFICSVLSFTLPPRVFTFDSFLDLSLRMG